MMSWDSKDSGASIFLTRTPLAYNYMSPVHTYYPVPAPHHTQIFTYITSEPPSPSHNKSSRGSITYTENPLSCNNPPNPVPNLPADPDSDPRSSDYSLLYLYDLSDSGYPKRGWRTKNNCRSKNRFNDPIKKLAKLTAKLLKAV